MILALAMFAALAPGGTVNRPVANMYSGPTADTDVVSQAIYGTPVAYVEQKPGWVKVRTPDDYTGWMQSEAIAAGRDYARKGTVARVESLFTHLYREPDVTKHAPMLTVPFETALEVVSEPKENEGRWIEVRLIDDRAAWVQRGDVSFDSKPISIPATIELARRFLGLPYTWGGTSSYGYDCSGFMQMLCRRRGALIPRDAQPQADWPGVMPVDRKDLQPGDLLYFGKSDKAITHTGMYIGNGEFINATTYQHPAVRIDRLDEPRWTRLFVAARRLK